MPDGPHTTRFSARATHSRLRSAAWVAAGIEHAVSSHEENVLPVGKPAAARRVAARGAFPAVGLGGEQRPQDLGGLPALRPGGG